MFINFGFNFQWFSRTSAVLNPLLISDISIFAADASFYVMENASVQSDRQHSVEMETF